MGRIYLNISGGGWATVSNEYPSAGEQVRLLCTPYTGESLLDIYGTDDQSQYIALYVQLDQTFTYGNWDYCIINVTFTYNPPTTSRKKKHMPIWMYPILRQRR